MREAEVRQIAVIVPAHNEQDLIGECLASLARSARALRPGVQVRVVTVLDGCEDDTASRITDPRVEVVSLSARCVGAARAVGAQRVLATATCALQEVWLANTDADSVVPEHWLPEMIRHADAGADLVVGTVVPDGERSCRGEIGLWHRAHTLAEGHPYVHGANLGIRAGAYVALGGWSALRSGEDADLVARGQLAGFSVARTANMPVRTSSRLLGRAPDGFASYLSTLAAQA